MYDICDEKYGACGHFGLSLASFVYFLSFLLIPMI